MLNILCTVHKTFRLPPPANPKIKNPLTSKYYRPSRPDSTLRPQQCHNS